MYIKEILQYLLWPLLIAMTWFAVKIALSVYEKKFPDREETEEPGIQDQ